MIELALTRSLLELPKYSSKYKAKSIETTRRFAVTGLITACHKESVNVILNPSTLLIEAIYKWGNETVHSGVTFPVEEIAYAHSIVDDLAYGRLGGVFGTEEGSGGTPRCDDDLELCVQHSILLWATGAP